MRFGNLIFGIALLLVASTLALTITLRNDPPPRVVIDKPKSSLSTQKSSYESARSYESTKGSARSSSRPQIPKPEEMDVSLGDGSLAAHLPPVERQAIAARANGVRRAALVKLDHMTERLDLTHSQRYKVFPLLVKSTNGYHPAMVITTPDGRIVSGESALGQSADEAIHDSLDPEQQEEFVETKIDEIAWWNEIVAQLEEEFDGAVAAGMADPSEEAGEEVVPENSDSKTDAEPKQGDNIFDLLNQ